MTLQGFEDVYFDMYHYHNDEFAWLCDRDAMVRRAMLPVYLPAFYKVRFGAEQSKYINEMWWMLEEDGRRAERFVKVFYPSIWTPFRNIAEKAKQRQHQKVLKKIEDIMK